MTIFYKAEVRKIGSYTLIEGDVETEQGEITSYWVEQNGIRVSDFTHIDRAEATLEFLGEQEAVEEQREADRELEDEEGGEAST